MATVSWTCQYLAPASMMTSISAGSSGITVDVICVFTLAIRPTLRQSLSTRNGFVVRAGDAAQTVVQRFEAVDRHAESEQAGTDCGLDHLS